MDSCGFHFLRSFSSGERGFGARLACQFAAFRCVWIVAMPDAGIPSTAWSGLMHRLFYRLLLTAAFVSLVAALARAHAAEPAPAEVSYNGMSADKQAQFRVKVNADKTIAMVGIKVVGYDAAGKKTDDFVYQWQNIQPDPVTHGTSARPIEKGKTYEGKTSGPPMNSVKVELKLDFVNFKDGGYWAAPK
jgi:hypothetical protein